ncbi:Uncharacterised protein [Mycobacteroides abscessus subsp. abscessus]|nr:Uncharacterised protein [Mycobacteroides abscessus subsp. abscessus]
MTTCDPGAMLVLTHGLVVKPFSTAFLASRAAPSMTDGLEVLVQDVMPATTTAPWSNTKLPRSADVTLTGLDGRPSPPLAADGMTASSSAKDSTAESLAGNDSSTASSRFVCGAGWFSST